MLADWMNTARRFSAKRPDLWTRDRKVLRGRKVVFEEVGNDLRLKDFGYTDRKLSDLRRLYLHDASRQIALDMWERRRASGKYGSVSFTTYGHFEKHRGSKLSSDQGPCLQSVTLTLLDEGLVGIDVFYRSTEFFKKFPADLVFIRGELLNGFEGEIDTITFHFANVTVHPAYWAIIAPVVDDPVRELEALGEKDKRFHRYVVKHTAQYLCPEHLSPIANHTQSLRVRDHLLDRLDEDTADELRRYLRRELGAR